MNLTTKKSILALVLLLSILVSTLACAGNDGGKQNENVTTTGQVEPEEEITDGLDDINMQGYEFNMLNFDTTWFTWGNTRILAEEQTGDIVNDAIYLRQTAIEDRFNCTLKITEIERTTDSVKKNVLAGDNTYQLYSIYEQDFGALLPHVMDCNDLPYLRLNEKHWNPNAGSMYNFSGRQLALAGNISLSVVSRATCMVFNKRIYQNYFAGESLYEYVKNNKWTMDKYFEIATSIGRDLDGDEQWTINDLYGISSSFKMYIGAFLDGAGLGFTDANETDGIPTFNLHKNEASLSLVTRLMEAMSVGGYYYNDEAEVYNGSDLFKPGNALFAISAAHGVSNLRAMEDDIGILPLPKYSENQENYYSISFGGTLWILPKTANLEAEGEYIGTILEAMSFAGYYDIIPQYKEIVLKTKSARDTESAEMLDIIFDSVRFDFDMNLLFDSNLQFSVLPALWKDKSAGNIVSICERNTNVINKYIKDFFEDVEA